MDSHFTLSRKLKDIKEINNGVSVESLFIHLQYLRRNFDKSSALKSLNLKDGSFIFGLIRKYKGLDLAIRAMSNKLIMKRILN